MGIGAMSRPAVFFDRYGIIVEEIHYAQTGEWEAAPRVGDVRLIARLPWW
jgi:hypothetical protein